MIPQDMCDLLTQRNTAIVGIDRPSGGPHLSPVWYLWDGDSFYFRIAKSTAKYRHLKWNPSISLLVNDHTGFRYLTVYGQAQILEVNPADVAAHIVKKYYAPTLAPKRMPQGQEPDVVTIKLRPEKVVAVVETIAREATDSWSSCS
ncbi:MAG: TIGR03618 family F420-dependent PPOX class oxidoreductase [Ktedonobacteraceae bacterium]|nr:TIGR03618 family F420-dependent PPOX class oxidoreductase [Ktedonobacteraceae bacterium]